MKREHHEHFLFCNTLSQRVDVGPRFRGPLCHREVNAFERVLHNSGWVHPA
jgi:hypothetical protein